MKKSWLFLSIFLFPISLWAGEIVLKSGESVKGRIIAQSNHAVTIAESESEARTYPLGLVQEIKLDEKDASDLNQTMEKVEATEETNFKGPACDEKEKQKLDFSTPESLQRTLAGTSWYANTSRFSGAFDFQSSGTYYAVSDPNIHGTWAVTAVNTVKLVTNEGHENYVYFDSTKATFWGKLDDDIALYDGHIQCQF